MNNCQRKNPKQFRTKLIHTQVTAQSFYATIKRYTTRVGDDSFIFLSTGRNSTFDKILDSL